jgi:hypothetical protein
MALLPADGSERSLVQRHQLLRELRRRIDPDSPHLGSYDRHPSRRGKMVTQDELAETIGVTSAWYAMLESVADARASKVLLDRVGDALMISPEQRDALFQS